MNIPFGTASLGDIDEASGQIKISYTAAYRGLMDNSYLGLLEDDPFLR